MKKRTTWIALGLLMACWVPLTFGLAQERTNLGVITIPRDAEFPAEGGEILSLPQGEYTLILVGDGEKVTIVLKSEDTGMAFGCDTKANVIKENYPEPKSEVNVVTKDGMEYVQIVVFKGNIQAVSMFKCSK